MLTVQRDVVIARGQRSRVSVGPHNLHLIQSIDYQQQLQMSMFEGSYCNCHEVYNTAESKLLIAALK